METTETTHALISAVLRWFHIVFGIVWIGHLYFFNFVQVNYEKALNPDLKKAVVPEVRGRALWWFRWGAMITLATGLLYLIHAQLIVPGGGKFADWFGGSYGRWITYGMALGFVMWFNVWFVIWPRQRVILASIAGQREKPADFDALVATAGRFSKINAYLSLPMIFGMSASKHFVMGAKGDLIMMGVVLVVGVGIAVHLVLHIGPKVGREFVISK